MLSTAPRDERRSECHGLTSWGLSSNAVHSADYPHRESEIISGYSASIRETMASFNDPEGSEASGSTKPNHLCPIFCGHLWSILPHL